MLGVGQPGRVRLNLKREEANRCLAPRAGPAVQLEAAFPVGGVWPPSHLTQCELWLLEHMNRKAAYRPSLGTGEQSQEAFTVENKIIYL